MNILQINSANSFGGGEKHLVGLAAGLKLAGHEVFFAVRRGNCWQLKLKDFDSQKIFGLPLYNAFDFLSAARLAKIIKQNKIEIVHAHVARDYPLAVLAARLAGGRAAVVLTRHVLFPLNPLHRLLLRNVSAIIAVSVAVTEQLAGQHIFSQGKIKCIPNALTFEGEKSEPSEELKTDFRSFLNIEHHELLVTTIGELKLLKGQADFLHAAEIVLQKFPNTKFAVAGKDNSKNGEFKKSLELFAHRRNFRRNILWLDFVDDINPVLSATDVFVSASHSESFGMAILEAMAAGKAIVATRTAGAAELLRDNETGKLVSVRNIKQMADAVCDLLESSALRRQLGASAQKVAQAKFLLAEMINTTERVYLECLAQKNSENSLKTARNAIEPLKFERPVRY